MRLSHSSPGLTWDSFSGQALIVFCGVDSRGISASDGFGFVRAIGCDLNEREDFAAAGDASSLVSAIVRVIGGLRFGDAKQLPGESICTVGLDDLSRDACAAVAVG